MIERRRMPRRRVCLGGVVRVAAFLPGIDCTLRDVSLGGARLRLAATAALPDRFEIAVPSRGEVRRARLMWRAGEAAGLSFDDAGAPTGPEAGPAPPDPAPRRLH